ncbi:hypothetical protein BJ742DRAFT_827787 [Cladochytrium replicatum]|nr:hypothetical protein BJ742DRAFT_827787 [Cladochytrium replicatum]
MARRRRSSARSQTQNTPSDQQPSQLTGDNSDIPNGVPPSEGVSADSIDGKILKGLELVNEDVQPDADSDASSSKRKCPHLKGGVRMSKVTKTLPVSIKNGIQCGACAKDAKMLSTPSSGEKAESAKEGDKKQDAGSEETPQPSVLWLCLTCGQVNCGRNDAGHGVAHYDSQQHDLVMDLESLDVWCYACDEFVEGAPTHNQVIIEAKNAVGKLLQSKKEKLDIKEPPPTKASSKTEAKSVFLKKGKSSKNQKAPAPGLTNLGNTCFFNSVVQAMIYTPPLQMFSALAYPSGELGGPLNPNVGNVNIRPGSLTQSLARLISIMNSQLESGATTPITPQELFARISERWKIYKAYRQEDSHELMRRMLDGVKEEHMSKGPNGKPINRYQRTFVDDIFGGKLVSVIVCNACKNITYNLEDFMDLSLPIVSEEKKSGFFGMKRASASASVVDKLVDGMANLTVGKEPAKTSSKGSPTPTRNEVDSPFSENQDHLNLISVLLRQVGPPEPAPVEHAGKKPILVSNKKTLMSCMRNMMAVDVLDGDNAFACEYCFKLSLISKISADAPSSGTEDTTTAAVDTPRIVVNGGTESVRGSDTDERTGSGLEDEDRSSTRSALTDQEKSIEVPPSPTNMTTRLMSTMSNALMSRSRSLASSLSSTTSVSNTSRQSSPARDLPAPTPVAPRLGDISIKRRAYKRYLIHSTPEILVLTLKRFILVGSSGRTKKVEESVAFDEFVDLSPMMAPDEVIALSEQMHVRRLRKELAAKIRAATAAVGGAEVKPVEVNDDDDSDLISPSSPLAKATASDGEKPSLRYRVYAAVVHSGSLFGGHYTAFVRSRKRPADISVKPFEARAMNAAGPKSPSVEAAQGAPAEAARPAAENGGEETSASVVPANGGGSSSSLPKVPEEEDAEDNEAASSAVGVPANEDGASTLVEENGAGVDGEALAEEADDWIYCSDTHVRKASFEEVMNCQAYILFYERVGHGRRFP